MVGKLTPNTEMSCSRLPALLGLSPWSTPNDELAKTFDALQGKEPPPWEGNELTEWGNLLEPLILEQAINRIGNCDLIVPDTPYKAPGLALNASLDGIIDMHKETTIKHDPSQGVYVMDGDEIELWGNGLLEAKSTRGEPENEPAPYRGPVQLQGCMICTGLTWGCVAVLYKGSELRLFFYKRNDVMINRITDCVNDFERRKHGPDWYSPFSSSDAAKTWAQVDDSAPPVNLPDDLEPVLQVLLEAKEAKKMAENLADTAQKQIMEALGNHQEGILAGHKIRWPMRNYKAQPEKVTPAKEAYSFRQSTLTIKAL